MTTQNKKMPVLFVGHGSPMNAIETNDFSQKLNALGQRLPRPKAILVISAHWRTSGTQVVGAAQPQTIHDFYGFPEKLFSVNYPAPGSPTLAKRIHEMAPNVKVTRSWGLDHGAWSVLKHLYPEADIPVLQLSLDDNLTAPEHYHLARGLKNLREEGVLIMGSGNIVHNLREIRWHDNDHPHVWAVNFDEYIRKALVDRDFLGLIEYDKNSPEEAAKAVPTSEHYLPLLYAFAATEDGDKLSFPVEGIQMASLSMRTALWEAA